MKKKKIASLAAVGALAVVVLLSGTYAWQSISQRAKNEVNETRNPGARLHDDFNFNADGNKDVYVENFADSTNQGVPVYARIRLDEYLEIGTLAGEPDGTQGKDVKIIKNDGTNPVLGTDSTWTTYKWEREKAIEDNGSAPLISNEASVFRKYFLWNQGTPGAPYYMPTFNMNKDNITADINGTLLGADGTGNNPYSDYTVYNANAQKTDIAIYDADDDIVDEAGNVDMDALINEMTKAVTSGTGREWDTSKLQDTGSQWKTSISVGGTSYPITVKNNGSGVVEYVEVDLDNTTEAGMDVRLVQETHTAKAVTTGAKIISMEKWIDEGSQAGNYWVYDTDGWVYWANKIDAGETTGLLLDKIEIRNDATIEDEYYYAINVVAQFCTRSEDGAWTDFAGISSEAKAMLNKLSGVATENYNVSFKVASSSDASTTAEVEQGTSIVLNAASASKAKAVPEWTWSVANKNSETALAYGTELKSTTKNGRMTLNVGMGETAGTTLVVTARYQDADGNYGVGTFEVTVKGSSEVETIRSEITTQAATVVAGNPDSYKTVTIDGQVWQIVAKNAAGTQALLYAKSSIDYDGSGVIRWLDTFGSNNTWNGSKIQKYLNSTKGSEYEGENGFAARFPHVAALAEETTFKTRQQITSKDFYESTDKVFLLSEADMDGNFMGKWNGSAWEDEYKGVMNDDYTVKDSEGNGVKLFTTPAQRKDTENPEVWSWLRSPRYSANSLAIVTTDGNVYNANRTNAIGGLRPAFWVNLSSGE